MTYHNTKFFLILFSKYQDECNDSDKSVMNETIYIWENGDRAAFSLLTSPVEKTNTAVD